MPHSAVSISETLLDNWGKAGKLTSGSFHMASSNSGQLEIDYVISHDFLETPNSYRKRISSFAIHGMYHLEIQQGVSANDHLLLA